MNFISQTSFPKAVTIEEVQSATTEDSTLQAVITMIQTGSWHEVKNHEGSSDDNHASLLQFRSVQDELTGNDSANLIFRDTRIVIPASLQGRVIQLAHEGHQGESKTKAPLRSKVWFPGIDAAFTEAVQRCIPCQANTSRCKVEPLSISDLPRGPWLNLSIYFCGPLPSGQYLLVMIDEYSRFPVVEVVRSNSAETVIPVVDKVFSTYGYPELVKSDNGPPFNSQAWKDFLTTCGVKHRKITPLWPQANAQTENFTKPMMKALRAAHIQGYSWINALHQFLRVYRCTPHSTTTFTPYYLLFGREPQTKLPEISVPSHPDDKLVRLQDTLAKSSMKRYSDRRMHAQTSSLQVGDTVLVRQRKANKLSTPFDPQPLVVADK